MASEGQLQRTILRLVQNHPGGLQRTLLSVQARPHSAQWDDVLRDLIDRNLIVEGAQVRKSKRNHRAVIVYALTDAAIDAIGGQRFEDMTKEEVAAFVDQHPSGTQTAVA